MSNLSNLFLKALIISAATMVTVL